MKAYLYSILIALLITSCSKVEENNDPIIGIWRNNVKTAVNANRMIMDNEEWIFNDVYLGRFHGYTKGKVIFFTDFKWTVDDGSYRISYPGTDFPDDVVHMEQTEEGGILLRTEGKIFALKQN